MASTAVIQQVYHFPQLHEGSCFYDILSRYHEQSAHLSSRATSMELFGACQDLRCTVTLPYRAELVRTWLGASSQVSVEMIRDQHSAWQYLQLSRRFSLKSLEPIVQAEARPGRKQQTKMRTLLQGNLSSLRYCPRCLLKDYLEVGEPYWHQLHQLYGVKYCPFHRVSLAESGVSISKRLDKYVTASEVFKSISLKDEVLDSDRRKASDPHMESYIDLAVTIGWLLDHGAELKEEELDRRYSLAVGKENGLATGEELASFLLDVEGEGFLSELFPGQLYSEAMQAIRKGGISTLSPLMHALLLSAERKTKKNYYET